MTRPGIEPRSSGPLANVEAKKNRTTLITHIIDVIVFVIYDNHDDGNNVDDDDTNITVIEESPFTSHVETNLYHSLKPITRRVEIEIQCKAQISIWWTVI